MNRQSISHYSTLRFSRSIDLTGLETSVLAGKNRYPLQRVRSGIDLMTRFIFRRLVTLVPLLFGVSVIVFLLLHLGPNDPAMSYLRLSNIPPTDAALEEARETLGLNRPLLEQYLAWLSRAVRLDFGISYTTKAPVTRHLLHYLPNTIYLAAVSMLITVALSLPLGILAAKSKGRWPDHLSRLLAYIGVSTPSFWLAFLMIIVFAVRLGWLPTMGLGASGT